MLMLFYQAFRLNSVFYAKMVSDFRRNAEVIKKRFLEVAGGGNRHCIWLQNIGGQGDKEKG